MISYGDSHLSTPVYNSVFFFNDTATTEIYTLSLHDALPISERCRSWGSGLRTTSRRTGSRTPRTRSGVTSDRKSTRLNSSHLGISYAVFCLKKKKHQNTNRSNPCFQKRRRRSGQGESSLHH